MCAVAGCGNLIGLGGYSVADDVGVGEGGTGNVAGRGVAGSSAGEVTGEGGSSGTSDGDSGAAGASGSAETSGSSGIGGSAGTGGSTGASGSAGSAGASASCPAGCDDSNDCTRDSCLLGVCAHDPLAVGEACGVARSCDAQAVCVRCRDTAAGTAQDAGCSPTAKICLGTGLDAVCTGCTTAADCNDGNECTTEACTAGKCVFGTVPAGNACTTGVCNGSASAEKCVACVDSAAGSMQDAGCASGKPVCEASGTPTCYECLNSSDCATDNVSCTVETCTNHVCSHLATDSLCTASGDLCKPSRCDKTVGCKQVDISTQITLVDASVGNGSFELGSKPATGWGEDGEYWITQDCGTAGCTPGSNNGLTKASAGKSLAWLGGILDAGVGDLSKTLVLPAGATTLRILADTNFQTQSTAATNKDSFQVRLMDASYIQIGGPLLTKSNAEAQMGPTHPWTANGVDVTANVSAHAGKVVSVSFWSSCDTASVTDFYVDNVRIAATICQ